MAGLTAAMKVAEMVEQMVRLMADWRDSVKVGLTAESSKVPKMVQYLMAHSTAWSSMAGQKVG